MNFLKTNKFFLSLLWFDACKFQCSWELLFSKHYCRTRPFSIFWLWKHSTFYLMKIFFLRGKLLINLELKFSLRLNAMKKREKERKSKSCPGVPLITFNFAIFSIYPILHASYDCFKKRLTSSGGHKLIFVFCFNFILFGITEYFLRSDPFDFL